jgi:hypothetical protein
VRALSVAVVLLVGCAQAGSGEVVPDMVSSLQTTRQVPFVPAYYPKSDADSRTALIRSALGATIVLNFDSGPGTTYDADDEAWVASLQQDFTGNVVLGYVANRYDPNGANIGTQEQQILSWASWYHVDGVFFDVSERSLDGMTDAQITADVARMEHLMLYAFAHARRPEKANVAFNWGGVVRKMERYVSCAKQLAADRLGRVIFGARETDEATYQGAAEADAWKSDSTTWVRLYPPNLFFHLVYAADPAGAGIAADIALSRARNAGNVLITDGGIDGTPHWHQLPGRAAARPTDLFDQQQPYVAGGHAADFPDASPAAQSGSCPAPL